MPRHGRSIAADFPMHVIQRGIDPIAIFFGEGDDWVFSDTLAMLAQRKSVRVHDDVLMTDPSADDAGNRRWTGSADEGAWPTVRAVHQANGPSNRDAF